MLAPEVLQACCHRPDEDRDWAQWLQELQSPLAGCDCGQELNRDPRFLALKADVATMGGIDFSAVFSQSGRLLDKESKDLRPAGYLLLAATHEYGCEGLLMSLLLCNRLMLRFESACFPHKDKARQLVHHWLLGQQPRLMVFLEQSAFPAAAPVLLHRLHDVLAEHAVLAAAHLHADAGPLSQLTEWVNSLLAGLPSPSAANDPATSLDTSPAQNAIPSSNPQPAKSPVDDTEIDSEVGFRQAVTALLGYDRDAGTYRRMLLLARAARWGTMQLPLNAREGSNIPAPRSQALRPVIQSLATGQWQAAFELAEKLFMENTLHFNLDLQRVSHEALMGAGLTELARQLEQQLLLLIEEHPQWPMLTYEDGTAMADRETQDWIQALRDANAPVVEPAPAGEISVDIEQEALAWVEKGHLNKALACVDEAPMPLPRELLQRRLMQARLCLAAQQPTRARCLLLFVLAAVERHHLGKWWPALAIAAWRAGLQCFELLLADAAEGEATALKEQILRLEQHLMLTSPAEAVRWLGRPN